jgi:hypothetical protein
MASKKKSGTDVAVVNAAPPAVVQSNLPAYLQEYKGPTGTENIDREDVALPRLKLGQGLSAEVVAGRVKQGDIFLNVSGEVVVPKGSKVPFVIVAQAKELILWRPRQDNGGGILARARPVVVNGQKRYAWDKANQSFDVKVGGKVKVTWKTKEYVDQDGLDQWGSEIPGDKESGIAATAHHNYVVVFPTLDNLMAAFSLSRTAAPRAKDLNAMLKMGKAPVFARQFNVFTTDEKNDQGEFANVKFEGAGFVAEDQFNFYRSTYASFAGKTINVDQSDGGDAEADDRA